MRFKFDGRLIVEANSLPEALSQLSVFFRQLWLHDLMEDSEVKAEVREAVSTQSGSNFVVCVCDEQGATLPGESFRSVTN